MENVQMRMESAYKSEKRRERQRDRETERQRVIVNMSV